jgi:hypothetical protein
MQAADKQRTEGRLLGKIMAGLVLMLLGVAFLMDNLDILDIDLTMRFWPLLLVLMGLGKIFFRGALNMGGHFLLVGGLLMQSWCLDFGYHSRQWWPLAIVWIGLVMVLRAIFPRYANDSHKHGSLCQDAPERTHEQQS